MSQQTRFPLAALLPIFSTICLEKIDDGVAMSAMEAKPLKAGTKAPESLLTNLEGKQENLSSILSSRPTVLIFYRGGWCPFCNTHLAELGKIESDIRKKGYQIVAISSDLPSELNKTLDKQHLTYKLYSDASAEAMKKFGVAYRLDDKTFTMYRDSYKIDLEKSSGQKHHILPVPSVFIIERSGKITFVSSNPDYKVRMKGSEILKAIESK